MKNTAARRSSSSSFLLSQTTDQTTTAAASTDQASDLQNYPLLTQRSNVRTAEDVKLCDVCS